MRVASQEKTEHVQKMNERLKVLTCLHKIRLVAKLSHAKQENLTRSTSMVVKYSFFPATRSLLWDEYALIVVLGNTGLASWKDCI